MWSAQRLNSPLPVSKPGRDHGNKEVECTRGPFVGGEAGAEKRSVFILSARRSPTNSLNPSPLRGAGREGCENVTLSLWGLDWCGFHGHIKGAYPDRIYIRLIHTRTSNWFLSLKAMLLEMSFSSRIRLSLLNVRTHGSFRSQKYSFISSTLGRTIPWGYAEMKGKN